MTSTGARTTSGVKKPDRARARSARRNTTGTRAITGRPSANLDVAKANRDLAAAEPGVHEGHRAGQRARQPIRRHGGQPDPVGGPERRHPAHHHRVGGPDVRLLRRGRAHRAARPAVDPRRQGQVGPRGRVARVAGPGHRGGISRTRARSISRTTRSIRRPAPCASGACSPTRTRRSPPAFSPASACPSVKPHRALLVTDRAIDTDQGQKILYVVNEKNEVVSRPVRLGALHDGLREITDGLKPGERVIVNGLQQVRPGVTVEPKLVDMPTSRVRDRNGDVAAWRAPYARFPADTGPDCRPSERRTVMLARFFIDRPVLAWVISDRHRPARGHRGGLLADRRVSGDHAADRPGDRQLPRGQRPGRGRHGGRADRAAGRRRRRDAVHVVAEQQRRLVHPGRDLRAGHQREHGPGAGAEPRRHRRADAPRRGPDHRRDASRNGPRTSCWGSVCIPRTTRRPAGRITIRST